MVQLQQLLICFQFLIPSVSTFSKTTMHCILKVFLCESKLWNNGQKIKKNYLKYTCEIYLWRKNYEIIVKIATSQRVMVSGWIGVHSLSLCQWSSMESVEHVMVHFRGFYLHLCSWRRGLLEQFLVSLKQKFEQEIRHLHVLFIDFDLDNNSILLSIS
jgi:hypothetical protein